MTNAPILAGPEWENHFRGNIIASQISLGANLTNPDHNERDLVIAFIVKKMLFLRAELHNQ